MKLKTFLIYKMKTLSVFIIVIVLLTACTSRNTGFSTIEKSNCYKQSDYQYTAGDLPARLIERHIDPILSENFSFESLNAANAIGLLDLLAEYTQLQKEKSLSLDHRLMVLELQHQISQKINMSSLEISSVTSELDCEEKRTNQIANYLINQADDRERNLVIGSIAVGAVGAIASEVLNNDPDAGKSGSYVAIGAAIAETAFGILMLTNKKKVAFNHQRNTLGEIWHGPETSKTLPAAIWYYLNFKDEKYRKEALRELLVKNWADYGQIADDVKKKNQNNTEIYFGDGGKYSADELKNRADMYDQIESFIGLMKQDLKTLSIEFYQLK